jgi:hypothetical protein
VSAPEAAAAGGENRPVPRPPARLEVLPGFDDDVVLTPVNDARAAEDQGRDRAALARQRDILADAGSDDAPPALAQRDRLRRRGDLLGDSGGGGGGPETNLDRPRAQQRGGAGGPTRIREEEDETEEDPFKTDLLARLLGLDEESPVSVFGWLQGSFTGNSAHPRNGENFGVNPNNRSNAWRFQQLYFVVERLTDYEEPRIAGRFDYGFRFDLLFGTDWQQFHMNGLFDRVWPINGFGFDPVQFYGEVHLPFLTELGIDIKGGRFYSLAGYEAGQAPARPLNSTSYMFAYAHPFTQFGVMSTWHVTDQWNLYNGVVNGWDRWIDQTYRWGYAGGGSWDSADGRTNLTMTLNWGPNQFPRFFPADYGALAPNGVPPPPFQAGRRNLSYGSNNAILFATVLIHKWTERLTVIGETDQGFESNVPGLGPDGTVTSGQWYGLGGWFLYSLTDRLTGVYRAEAFRDNHGTRTGFNDTFYEMTLGMIYKPVPWFWLRPEARFDWANGAPPYDDATKHSQFTFGFDALFIF